MATTLLQEDIFADGVLIRLEAGRVVIDTGDDGDGVHEWVELRPGTRQAANRLSVALRKAQRRIEDIGRTLPDEAR